MKPPGRWQPERRPGRRHWLARRPPIARSRSAGPAAEPAFRDPGCGRHDDADGARGVAGDLRRNRFRPRPASLARRAIPPRPAASRAGPGPVRRRVSLRADQDPLTGRCWACDSASDGSWLGPVSVTSGVEAAWAGGAPPGPIVSGAGPGPVLGSSWRLGSVVNACPLGGI